MIINDTLKNAVRKASNSFRILRKIMFLFYVVNREVYMV
jgi:hypothetical protein